LLDLSIAASGLGAAQKPDLHFYKALAALVGWTRMGRLSKRVDRLRAWSRAEPNRTIGSIAARVIGWLTANVKRNPDAFLADCRGVIHVGANSGQERDTYAGHDLSVIWIEPIPSVFAELQRNIEAFPRQHALQYLVTDADGKDYRFNVANNGGASSSIFEFGAHVDIWPDVHYVDSTTMRSQTLATVVDRERIDIAAYDALVMDTQGSELLVLKGASSLLGRFKWIKTEAADFESYVGCCLLANLTEYLAQHDFRVWTCTKFAKRAGGGSYYDVVYRREGA
jgi:FkbM family methyltransferase